MFNILDLEKTEKYIIQDPTYYIVDKFVPGYMSYCVRNSAEEEFLSVSNLRQKLGFPKLYLDRGENREILECAFIKTSGKLLIIYDIKKLLFEKDTGEIIMCSNVISVDDRMNPRVWNPRVFETETEKQAEELLRRWNSTKREISKVEEYLEDPWVGYRTKEKSYKEKLVKCKAATENEILLKRARLKDLKKELKELEEGFIPGTKENREGN